MGTALPPTLPFVFLKDSDFYFPLWRPRQGRALRAWHGACDPGQAGEASNYAASSRGPASPPYSCNSGSGAHFKPHLGLYDSANRTSVSLSVKWAQGQLPFYRLLLRVGPGTRGLHVIAAFLPSLEGQRRGVEQWGAGGALRACNSAPPLAQPPPCYRLPNHHQTVTVLAAMLELGGEGRLVCK